MSYMYTYVFIYTICTIICSIRRILPEDARATAPQPGRDRHATAWLHMPGRGQAMTRWDYPQCVKQDTEPMGWAH